tara:strand:+ start:205 stop:333 length:129 start_codon:yes stop_codon:yes gene_type:complete
MKRFLLLALTAGLLSSTAVFANEDYDQLIENGWEQWDQENYK